MSKIFDDVAERVNSRATLPESNVSRRTNDMDLDELATKVAEKLAGIYQRDNNTPDAPAEPEAPAEMEEIYE